LVGPEGGFTAAEEKKIFEAGAVAVSLAPTILRVETAAIAFIAMLARM
jgi:16S rRNA (uracil1498-N3)-methyltransferase